MIEIRPEEPGDLPAVRRVNRRAFGQDRETHIVDALRANGAIVLSLVAVQDGEVVGHILYSRIDVGGIVGAALGPMAVLPEQQRQGIGTTLVETGNRQVARDGYPCIAVVGHPAFYPRFGFRPASTFGITCEWDLPDEVFMLLVLDAARMAGVAGTARYRSEFSNV